MATDDHGHREGDHALVQVLDVSRSHDPDQVVHRHVQAQPFETAQCSTRVDVDRKGAGQGHHDLIIVESVDSID